jgi:hypothetical protein
MLISPHYYYGVPKTQINALEAITQATINELFALAKQITNSTNAGEAYYYNDADYNIKYLSVIHEDYSPVMGTRLYLQNNACGYYAILQWCKPFERDPGIEDFWLHAQQGEIPEVIDWKEFNDALCYGKADLHIKARRMSSIQSWGEPFHKIDFRHPLMHALQGAVEELQELQEEE